MSYQKFLEEKIILLEKKLICLMDIVYMIGDDYFLQREKDKKLPKWLLKEELIKRKIGYRAYKEYLLIKHRDKASRLKYMIMNEEEYDKYWREANDERDKIGIEYLKEEPYFKKRFEEEDE